MSFYATILIVVIAIFATIWWVKPDDTWIGIYYPDGCLVCDDKYIYSPPFAELYQCQGWGNDLKLMRQNPSDDFECALNCKNSDGFSPMVCERTE